MPRRHPQNPKPQRRPAGPWLHGSLPVIGLVGGIGGGKSLAASVLAELGALVIDADKVGHTLLDQNPCRDIVVEVFGEGVLAPFTAEGERRPIDRKALGALVFADPFLLGRLEDILHPLMRRTFERAIAREVRRERYPAVVLDAAVLYEAEWNDLCDKVVFIDAAPEVRLARLEASRGWTAETLANREKAQGPLAEKRAEADVILANNATPDDLRAATTALWPSLLQDRPKSRPEIPLPPLDDSPRGRRGPRGQPST